MFGKCTEYLSVLQRYVQYFGLNKVGNAMEVSKILGECVDSGNTSTNTMWDYGSAVIRGTNLSKTGDCCMQQITVPSLNEKNSNGLFAMIDGGKAPDAATRIKKKLPSILNGELLASKERRSRNVEETPLLYIEHTFLTMHRYILYYIL